MTRFNIALLTLLLPAVLAAPSRRSTIVPCKRNSTRGPYDGGNSTDVYGPTGTGTGFPLSTGVPISILSSSLADASPDPSAAPVDSGSDDDCPATTTVTSTNIVTETVIPATDPAQTQASGSSAAGSAVLSFPAGPYGNSTDSSSRYAPGPTGTAGSTGRSSRHGHKHTHKTTKSPMSTGTSVAEVPASISTSAVPSSSSSDADSSSSEVATSETSDVASAVQVTSTTASSTVDPATSSDQPLTPTTTSSAIAVAAPTSTRSSTSESPSTGESYSASASSLTSASSTSAAGGEFYQGPKMASSTTITPSSTPSSSTSSSPSSSSEPSSSALASPAQSSTPPTSSLQSSTMTVPSSASITASSTTSPGVSATVGATPHGGYSSSPGTGKRGLAYNAAALTTCFDKSSEVSWAYNWGSSTSGLSNVFEYVPMLWGTQSEHTNNWQSAASAAIASGSKHLLSFNEPDLGSQSNLSPAAAVAGHKTYLQPFAGRAKISAPAVTNGGLAWLEQFLVACSSCTIDFVPVHWYDSATNIAYFKSYITSAIAAAKGRPIWITEFGASGTQAQQVAFLQEVMPWLDGQAAVERYAYFGVFDGKLVSGTSMSALGQTFATYT